MPTRRTVARVYFYEISNDIESQVDSPTVVHLHDLWVRYQAAAAALPELSSLGPERLEWCAPNLMVLDPIDNDFRYRYYGAGIAHASGFDMTGRCTSDFRSDVGRFFHDKYIQCLASRRPLYTVHGALHAPTVLVWERLLLPVRDHAAECLVVLNRPLTLRHEFLQGILDASGSGIASLAPLRDPSGNIEDFHFLGANVAAAHLFRSLTCALTDRRLSEVLPEDMNLRVTDLCVRALGSGEPVATEIGGLHNGVRHYLHVRATPGERFVTLMLSDVGESRRQAERIQELEEQLRNEVHARGQLEARLRERLDTDRLTGVRGGAGFTQVLGSEIAKARRHGRHLSVLVLDLDQFKAVTGGHGPVAGDDAIIATARLCEEAVREGDLVGRLAHTAFAACLPETDLAGALDVAQRLRAAVFRRFEDSAMLALRLTVSIGIADLREGDSPEALLARATQALARAQRRGGNQVVAGK